MQPRARIAWIEEEAVRGALSRELGCYNNSFTANDVWLVAASWPRAAAMSPPRVSRTVAGMRARNSTDLKRSICSRGDP